MKQIIVAIDGWSSCGKSTLARQLAQSLGYVYIDSGAMYRAVTLFLQRHQIDLYDEEKIGASLDQIHLSFLINPATQQAEIHLNGENVETDIRELSVANQVSQVSTLSTVRNFAVAQQQKMGAQKGIVMDGRDIGTTVFPSAELKIFMTASMEVRIERRYLEMKIKHPGISVEEVRHNLSERDRIDSTRAISPLTQAQDAILLDNTMLNMQEQLNWALERVREKLTLKDLVDG
jgi:cytidylate kinase